VITIKEATTLLNLAKAYAANEKIGDQAQRLYVNNFDKAERLDDQYDKTEEKLDRSLRVALLKLIDANWALAGTPVKIK